MLDRYIHDIVLSFLVGCIACLSMTSVNNADGRVFTMDPRGSSSLQGLRGAERACATRNARLASGAELRRAVLECSFSACTRGWLYEGTIGTTECRNAGSSLTAMEVRTENSSDHMANLNAFCVLCGDPPSFPNTRLQGQAGVELGDELLYVCVPGHRLPSGSTAFSLLCDSCGEWYGLVQMCLKGESEAHVDYEDSLPDGYGEVHRPAAYDTQRDAIYTAGRGRPERRDQQGEEARGEEEPSSPPGLAPQGASRGVGGVEEDDPPGSVQSRVPLVRPEAASQATTTPVSQLSQKHMFWFPSETFHEEGYPAPNDPVAQTTTADDDQSNESQEGRPGDLDGHRDGEREEFHVHDREESRHRDEQDDHNDSRHSDSDDHDDHHDHHDDHHDHHDDHDDHDDHTDGEDHDVHNNSRQEEEDQDKDLLDQRVRPYSPGQRDNVDRYGSRYDDDKGDPRDHYDMGEHEDERDHVLYGGGREDDDGEGEDHQESEEPREHHEHPEDAEEDLDGETGEEEEEDDGEEEEHDSDADPHADHDDDDHYDDHPHTDEDNPETDENDEHDDHDSHQDHDEDHEDDDDDDDDVVHRHPEVDFPLATDEPPTLGEAGRKPTTTTDQSWLDGYAIGPDEAEKGGSTEEAEASQEQEEVPVVVSAAADAAAAAGGGGGGGGATDKPNEADSEQDRVGDAWPGRFRPREPTPPPHSHESQESISDPDALDYEHTDDPALAWDEEDPSDRPFPDPKTRVAEDGEDADREASLPGEAGERAPVEGEMGEAICMGEDCPPPPPPTSSSRGPIVAAVIVAICAVATVAVVGAWLYRRRQQKNSMYQLNGKGQSQCTPEQQIEMQQKV
ncbi:hypothetical protein NHX12_023156 [Muraenolepis orangiensis]|uniref:Sushi domain-containing protein n=1 Tax=Muraenolepis orangiensis TaxID=630683 RepID=A0A9Q0EKD1_9TELE|nr:hypothetical protein NHX12_023156 [Muraenolepis orangiensis]